MTRLKDWKKEILEHKKLILLSLIFLGIAIFLDYLAGEYIETAKVSTVSDLILDNIPVINLSWIFIYGYTLVIAVGFLYALFFKIKDLHIVISQFSLLVLIRSFFITLTHLEAPVNAIIVHTPKFFNLLFFQNDLFFSGHTAIPFLGFLLFRKEKIGIFFLIMTFILASTVLLMHVHYSIDVFAAFFITYGSYKIGKLIFKRINGY
jgi:hypothetical protein